MLDGCDNADYAGRSSKSDFLQWEHCCGSAIENCRYSDRGAKKGLREEIALPPLALAASWLPDRASRVLRWSVSRHACRALRGFWFGLPKLA